MRDLTINDILKMLLAHIKLIIIISVVAALGAYIYADNFIPKKYSASSMICILYTANTQSDASADDDTSKFASGSINASTDLAAHCSVVFRYSEEMLEIIPAGYSVSISSVSESNILSISVTGQDGQVCADTANAIRNAAPKVFKKYYTGGEAVTFGRPASAPSTHSSPNETRYAVFGFVGGLIVSVLIAIILEIIDTTIKPDDDLYKMYNIPVFAEIIDFELEGGAKRK
ncbi:MAG: YveK family protein [Ruminococcus sp.]